MYYTFSHCHKISFKSHYLFTFVCLISGMCKQLSYNLRQKILCWRTVKNIDVYTYIYINNDDHLSYPSPGVVPAAGGGE